MHTRERLPSPTLLPQRQWWSGRASTSTLKARSITHTLSAGLTFGMYVVTFPGKYGRLADLRAVEIKHSRLPHHITRYLFERASCYRKGPGPSTSSRAASSHANTPSCASSTTGTVCETTELRTFHSRAQWTTTPAAPKTEPTASRSRWRSSVAASAAGSSANTKSESVWVGRAVTVPGPVRTEPSYVKIR